MAKRTFENENPKEDWLKKHPWIRREMENNSKIGLTEPPTHGKIFGSQFGFRGPVTMETIPRSKTIETGIISGPPREAKQPRLGPWLDFENEKAVVAVGACRRSDHHYGCLACQKSTVAAPIILLINQVAAVIFYKYTKFLNLKDFLSIH